jgi:hypothetical protein
VSHDDLRAGLEGVGYAVTAVPTEAGEFLTFAFLIPGGPRAGETIELGLQAVDFPFTPPGGIHVRPGFDHPGGNNHASPLGHEWRYWSRPFPEGMWVTTGKSVDDVLAHVRGLLLGVATS